MVKGYAPAKLRNMENKKAGIKITNADKLNEVLVTKDGNFLFEMGSSGRQFVVANIKGQKIPFYISAHGTDGKHAGEWYPFFGNTGNWLVKGGINALGEMEYHPEIDRVTKLLRDNLKLPQITFKHNIQEGPLKGTKLEDIAPELKPYTVADRFPQLEDGFLSWYNNLTEINNHPMKNNVVDALGRKNKQMDGLFVEEITGIDASNVENGTGGNGWISGRDHIALIIANIEKAIFHKQGGQINYNKLRK